MAFRPSLPPFILESAALRSQSAWTLMAQALLTGLVSGGVIGLFRWLYTIINGAVRAHMAGQDPFAPATLALMAAGLLLMALTAGLLLRYEPLIGGSGIPQVELIAAGKLPPMRWARVLWCKFVATLAALNAGLSVGREGPCIMMGATVGAGVGYMWHDRCRANRPRYLVGGGVAGMTAAFGAPVAGMFFAFEEMKTPLTLPMLLFTSLSALSAWFMVDVVLDFGLVFPFARLPGLHWSQYWLPLLAGMSCGLLGAVYNAGMIRLLLWQDRARWLPGPVRIVFPFVCCGVLLLVWPEITGNMGLTTLQLEHLRLFIDGEVAALHILNKHGLQLLPRIHFHNDAREFGQPGQPRGRMASVADNDRIALRHGVAIDDTPAFLRRVGAVFGTRCAVFLVGHIPQSGNNGKILKNAACLDAVGKLGQIAEILTRIIGMRIKLIYCDIHDLRHDLFSFSKQCELPGLCFFQRQRRLRRLLILRF